MKNLAIITVLLSIFTLSACSPYKNNPYRYPVYKKNKALPKANSINTPMAQTPIEPDDTLADAGNTQDNIENETVAMAETPENAAPQTRIHRMVAESRLELISSGMSPEYVDQHFQVVDMIDEENEKKVIWKYTIGEYEIIVIDPISWTVDAKEEILYTHGIKQELGTTRNIELVIPKKQALEIMHECLGDHSEISYAFTAREVPGNAIPWMISKSENNDGTWNIAYINLENGTCEKETGGAMPLMMEE